MLLLPQRLEGATGGDFWVPATCLWVGTLKQHGQMKNILHFLLLKKNPKSYTVYTLAHPMCMPWHRVNLTNQPVEEQLFIAVTPVVTLTGLTNGPRAMQSMAACRRSGIQGDWGAPSAPKVHGDELYFCSADCVWAFIRSLLVPVGGRVLPNRKGLIFCANIGLLLSNVSSSDGVSCAPVPGE